MTRRWQRRVHLADEHRVAVEAGGGEQHDTEHASLEIKGDLVHEGPLCGDCCLESALGPHPQHTLVQQVWHAHLPAHAPGQLTNQLQVHQEDLQMHRYICGASRNRHVTSAQKCIGIIDLIATGIKLQSTPLGHLVASIACAAERHHQALSRLLW